ALLVDLLVDQLDVEDLVPRELEVLAVDQLLVPEARGVDVLDVLRDQAVEAEKLILARVVADPALADREVDDVWPDAGVERIVEVGLEGGTLVLPVDRDARVGRLEAGDRVLDVRVKGGRQVERPEADLGVG